MRPTWASPSSASASAGFCFKRLLVCRGGTVEVAPLDGVVGLLVQRRELLLDLVALGRATAAAARSTRPVTPCCTARPRNSSSTGRRADLGLDARRTSAPAGPGCRPDRHRDALHLEGAQQRGVLLDVDADDLEPALVAAGDRDDGVEVVARLGDLRGPQDQQHRHTHGGVGDLLEVGVGALDDDAGAPGDSVAPGTRPHARPRRRPQRRRRARRRRLRVRPTGAGSAARSGRWRPAGHRWSTADHSCR